MTLIDVIIRTCEHVLNNLNDLTVNRLHSQYKQDLRIDNGAGAWILLQGDKVYISGGGTLGNNDGVFDRIYLGADMLCWIERGPTGNLVFHAAPGKDFEFQKGTY